LWSRGGLKYTAHRVHSMFTGIVQLLGTLSRREPCRIWLAVDGYVPAEGASVAVNGACLTVAAVAKGMVGFDVSEETLQRTTLATLRLGQRVNLEPALAVGEALGGHLVLGHVDAVGKVALLTRRGADVLLGISYPEAFAELLTDKGAVAVDGMSLTPFAVTGSSFRCAVLPYTWEHTNLMERHVGDLVNLEFDVLAKYVRTWRER